MLSLQRCSVNQASENNEMFDSLAPAKGILLGLGKADRHGDH